MFCVGSAYEAVGSCSGVGLDCSEVAFHVCCLGMMARAAVSTDQGIPVEQVRLVGSGT